MTKIHVNKNKLPLRMSNELFKLMQNSDLDKMQLTNWISTVKDSCHDNGDSALVREALAILEDLHNEGRPDAGKLARSLAYAANLPARSVEWSDSPPKRKRGPGRSATYFERRRHSLWNAWLYAMAEELCEEQKVSEADAYRQLAKMIQDRSFQHPYPDGVFAQNAKSIRAVCKTFKETSLELLENPPR